VELEQPGAERARPGVGDGDRQLLVIPTDIGYHPLEIKFLHRVSSIGDKVFTSGVIYVDGERSIVWVSDLNLHRFGDSLTESWCSLIDVKKGLTL
jgi:hypothetical protein